MAKVLSYLQEQIKAKGLKQKDLAIEAKIKGSEQYISQLFTLKRNLPPNLLKVLYKYDIKPYPTKADAEIAKENVGKHSKRDYKELFNIWISSKRKKGKTEKTLKGYQDTVGHLLDKVDLNTATREKLDNYFASMMKKEPNLRKGSNEASINRRISECKAFTNWLEDNDYISPSENIMARVDKYTVVKGKTKATIDMNKFIASLKKSKNIQHILLATLAYETGLRRTELANIKLSDIDFNDRSISVLTKRKKYRHPVFSEQSKKLMELWLKQKKGYSLNRKTGKKLDRKDYLFDLTHEGIYQALNEMGHRVGVKTNPHAFRRGLTLALLEQGLDIVDVKNIVGHEDIKTTMIYSGEYSEKKSQAKAKSPLAGINLDNFLPKDVGFPTMQGANIYL